MTWAIAKDAKRMALCVDTRSRAYLNIVERSAIAIEILADDITFGVKGTAQIVKERMDAPPFPCAIVIVDLDEVRDHGHPGTFFRGPTYHFHEDKAHRADFEQKVIFYLVPKAKLPRLLHGKEIRRRAQRNFPAGVQRRFTRNFEAETPAAALALGGPSE